MQDIIDEHILLEPPTLIDEEHLDLKLNTSKNVKSQNLIEKINEKINYLDNQKEIVNERFNKEIVNINNSGKGEITDLSSSIEQPLKAANSISSDIQNIKDQFFVIKENIEKLMQLKDLEQRREMLKKLKEKALRLKNFYEVYEKLKYFYENRDFIQVSILYNQIRKLNIGDEIKLVDGLLLPSLAKAINDKLFDICQNEFSFMSLFQCLLFVKKPSEVAQIITNKKHDQVFADIKEIDDIFTNYGYSFDVIYAIFNLKNTKNIVDLNGKPWDMPSKILDELVVYLNNLAKSFHEFIYRLDTQQNILSKWGRIESLLYITNSYPIIAFKIVSNILKSGNKSNYNNDHMNESGLLYQNLNECLNIYKSQYEKSYKLPHECEFVKNLIESIFVLLIRSLINNSFNQNHKLLNEMVNYFNNKSKEILKNDFKLELKIISKIDVELIQNDFQKIIEEIKKENSLMDCFNEDGFYDKVIVSFIPKFLKYSIPAFIGDDVKKYCSIAAFNGLKLKENFEKWSTAYDIEEASLRNIALEYFNFCTKSDKPKKFPQFMKNLFSNGICDPDILFKECYPLQSQKHQNHL